MLPFKSRWEFTSGGNKKSFLVIAIVFFCLWFLFFKLFVADSTSGICLISNYPSSFKKTFILPTARKSAVTNLCVWSHDRAHYPCAVCLRTEVMDKIHHFLSVQEFADTGWQLISKIWIECLFAFGCYPPFSDYLIKTDKLSKSQVSPVHFINNIGNDSVYFIYQDLRIQLSREAIK